MSRQKLLDALDRMGYEVEIETENRDCAYVVIRDVLAPDLDDIKIVDAETKDKKPWQSFQNRWGN